MSARPVSCSLLLVGLLLLHCSFASASTQVRAHVARMGPAEQQLRYEMQQNPRKAQLQQAAPGPAPLDPACVPKYVTDLVIPPPMPLSTAPPPPVVGAKARRNKMDEKASRYIAEDEYYQPVQAQLQRTRTRRSASSSAGPDEIMDTTRDWEFKSSVERPKRSRDSTDEPKQDTTRADPPVPKTEQPPTLNDDYWDAWGYVETRRKIPNGATRPRPRREPEAEDDEEQQHESHYGHGIKRGGGRPPRPPKPEPEPTPPVNPPPVNPPAVNPPHVNPPPVNPPPVNPPPVNPPPVNPPPVNPPPVNPPPVNPPPVNPPPVNPPPPVVTDFYDISVRQIQQNVLPPTPNPLPTCPSAFAPTTVFAYGPANVAGQPFHNWPGFTIEAQRGSAVQVNWINDLKDAAGNFLPHILSSSIDQTLHWANPAALGGNIDSSPCHACSQPGVNNCALDPGCVTAFTTTYTGPVPIVTHVHGQNTAFDWADGYAEAWFTPNANNMAGYFDVGTWYDTFQQQYTTLTGQDWAPGTSTSIYRNTQRAAPLWYHDHTLGLTRTNVFAGMAGLYFLREKFPSVANGPELPGIPYPAYDGIIPLNQVRELPLAIQDRSFTTNGQLWYPVANNAPNSALPNGPLHPSWIPEYSATVVVNGAATNMLMMTVNGRTYPKQTVYPDAYRLRILNGCNSRTLQLRFARSTSAQIDPLAATATASQLPFFVIGNEGGFFPQLQAAVTSLEVGPAERYDVIIDFSGLAPGQFVFMLNNGPETDTGVYNGNNNGVGLTVHTAQIMRFDVTPLPAGSTSKPFDLVQQFRLDTALQAYWAATVAPIAPSAAPVREVALLEDLAPNGLPIALYLGTAAGGTAVPTPWQGPVTTDVALGVSHYWDIINLSADAHPVHLHNVAFEYFGRFALQIDPLNPRNFVKTTTPVTNSDLDSLLTMPCGQTINGAVIQCPVPKDTIMVLPGSYTRIGFTAPAEAGLFVWHCHLYEHEDNEMMVPFCFGSPTYPDPKRPGQLMCPGPN